MQDKLSDDITESLYEKLVGIIDDLKKTQRMICDLSKNVYVIP